MHYSGKRRLVTRFGAERQTSDRIGVATPASWKPGDKVIVPPRLTTDDAAERMKKGFEWGCRRSCRSP